MEDHTSKPEGVPVNGGLALGKDEAFITQLARTANNDGIALGDLVNSVADQLDEYEFDWQTSDDGKQNIEILIKRDNEEIWAVIDFGGIISGQDIVPEENTWVLIGMYNEKGFSTARFGEMMEFLNSVNNGNAFGSFFLDKADGTLFARYSLFHAAMGSVCMGGVITDLLRTYCLIEKAARLVDGGLSADEALHAAVMI